MPNNIPRLVVKEFEQALDQHEQDMRTNLIKHLNVVHADQLHMDEKSTHHIDATGDEEFKPKFDQEL